jgi:hypothetical protein
MSTKILQIFSNKKAFYIKPHVLIPLQQNGISERKNRHLLEVTRTLLFQNNVPKFYWSDVVLTTTYLINRLPSMKLKKHESFRNSKRKENKARSY